jgi:toxin ParE1/3/4
VSAGYLVRPKADRDIEEQAFYLATQATPELGHRFLLASHPRIGWHPHLRLPDLKSLRVFRISGFENMLVLYRPLFDGVEILRVVHGSRNLKALQLREGLE